MAKPVFAETLQINEESIKQDVKTKFLGVILDDRLSWSYHINYIKKKIAKGIGIVCRAKYLLNIKTLCTLYHSFVYPYLNYAAEVWGDACDIHLKPILKLQKKAIRIITQSGRLEHTRPLFTKLNILRLEEILFYKVALTMFKVYHYITPNSFSSLFVRNTDVHGYGTRIAEHFNVHHRAKTNYMLNAISIKGVKIWNKIYMKINFDCSFVSFKIALKKYIINNTKLISYLE